MKHMVTVWNKNKNEIIIETGVNMSRISLSSFAFQMWVCSIRIHGVSVAQRSARQAHLLVMRLVNI